MSVKFISGSEHYSKVFSAVSSVKKSLWIGTADIKDVYVRTGDTVEPFLSVIARLLKRGVEVRLIHAKEPTQRFRDDFDRNPTLISSLERMLCPRVHFKIFVFDFKMAYIGSANLTGAAIGMRGDNKRNFEAGIFTDDANLVDTAIEQFDSVWRGEHCRNCGRKEYCLDPII